MSTPVTMVVLNVPYLSLIIKFSIIKERLFLIHIIGNSSNLAILFAKRKE